MPRPLPRSAAPMAVGQRVFVDSAGNRSGDVILADESGKVPSATHLADGTEVEVVAWRPRGASDTRYRVRAPHGIDGWLPSNNLRVALVRPPAPERPAPAGMTPLPDHGTRPFGQQSHTARPLASASPTPVEPSRDVPGGGRRFGQHF